jgi:hypothetical protein
LVMPRYPAELGWKGGMALTQTLSNSSVGCSAAAASDNNPATNPAVKTLLTF